MLEAHKNHFMKQYLTNYLSEKTSSLCNTVFQLDKRI